MGDRASAERACKEPNPIIDGRKANVNLAILGAKPRGNLAAGKLKKLLFSVAIFIICTFFAWLAFSLLCGFLLLFFFLNKFQFDVN